MAGGAALDEVATNVKDDDEGETKEEPKEKSSKGVFDRIANRLKRHSDKEKHADEPKRNFEEPEKPVVPLDRAVDDGEPADVHDEDAAVASPVVGSTDFAAAGGIEDEQASTKDEEEDEGKGKVAGATLGLGAAGAGAAAAAAAAVGLDRTGTEDNEEEGDPSRTGYVDKATHIPKDNDEDGSAGDPTKTGFVDEETHIPLTGDEEGDPRTTGYIDEETHIPMNEDESTGGEVDDDETKGKVAGAMLGLGALGAGAAALVGFARSRQGDQEELAESSSLSTEEAEPEDERPPLESVGSAEHDGSYVFAMPSPAVQRKPDLERHISTIQDSSGEEEGSDDVDDSDSDEGQYFGRPVTATREEDQPVQNRVVSPPTEDDAAILAGTVPGEERRESSVSPLAEVPRNEDETTVLAEKDVALAAPKSVAAPASEEPSSAAPAPVVKTSPSDEQPRQASKLSKEKDKEHKGIRGLISKLKNRPSKTDNKLRKSPPSDAASEKSFQGGAKLTGANAKDDDITPVTTTSAGREAEGLPSQHIGTDGPIGDPTHVSGLGGDPRPVSSSSFTRHDEELKDLDDVSSSGVEEEDIERGRSGRLAQKLGLGKGKGRASEDTGNGRSGVSNGEEEQFEEARDHFDESLAPPPAFGGQPKSESPVRETKFQEQF